MKSEHKSKICLVECSVCKKDSELYGDGVFKGVAYKIKKGGIPCACCHSFEHTEDQQKVRVKRQCDQTGYEFLGWFGNFNGVKTKIKLLCKPHGVWTSTNISRFISGVGCLSCLGFAQTESEHISGFISTKRFKVGTIFTKSDKNKYYWNYYCPACSNDEYVQAGLCSGVFSASIGQLKGGRLPCRCSKVFRWTQEQREYQINKKIIENGSKYVFDGWLDSYESNMSKIKYICPKHGNKTSNFSNFMAGYFCAECNGLNQKQAYVNVVYDGDSEICLKFGIATDTEFRINKQNKLNKFHMKNIYTFEFKNTEDCKEAERLCKKTLDCYFLSKKELKDGFTETTSLDNLEKILEIYKSFNPIEIKY